ncbi:MAG TPA: hypothetical protein VMW10_01415 [Alphaproteobacteria bacterium]|nr:hypothetical protein [Alphaproteobacteria bacterium]
MATKIATIYSLITANIDPLKKGLVSARDASVKGAAKIQNALNKINFKAIALGATAMAATLSFAASKFIKLAIEQEAVEKRLGAVIKSTGQAAGYTLEELKKLAAGMQKVTTTGDETILSGMAILATFKQIRGEAFERTTMSALDLAEVVGQDLNSAMIQLGKALNDPMANLGALSRAGIQFTKQQKELIKGLWEAGKTAEAQSLILDELESQFGGAAKAARDTFGGALKSLKNTLGDIGETIGFALMPPVKEIIDKFSNWIEKNEVFLNQDMPGYISAIADNIGAVALQLGKIAKYAGLRGIMDTYLQGIELSTKGLIDYNTFVAASFFERQKMVDEAIKKTEELGRITKKITKDTPGYADYVKKKSPILQPSINTDIKPSYPGADAFEMNRFRQSEILKRDADRANEILLESNKRVVPVLTDLWATYNNEQVQAAAAMSAEKAETLRLWEEENKKTSNRMLELSERTSWAMQETFSDVFYDQMKGKLETFKDYFSSFLDTMQRAWADIMGQMMTQWIFGKEMKGGGMLEQAWGFISGIFGGMSGGSGGAATSLSSARWSPRAAGGPVSVGSPYLVGEKGPELFVPDKSGDIISGKNMRSGGVNNITVYNITANDAASFVELARRSGAVPLLAAENLADNGSLRRAIAESL